MGMADIAEVLWRDYLNHNPTNPHWADRDRFVLSNGHGSMLIYSLLHLTGYDLPMRELENFRQLHSKTRGTRSTATPRALKPPPARWAGHRQRRRLRHRRAHHGGAVQPPGPRHR